MNKKFSTILKTFCVQKKAIGLQTWTLFWYCLLVQRFHEILVQRFNFATDRRINSFSVFVRHTGISILYDSAHRLNYDDFLFLGKTSDFNSYVSIISSEDRI